MARVSALLLFMTITFMATAATSAAADTIIVEVEDQQVIDELADRFPKLKIRREFTLINGFSGFFR
jgi:hypothetical protein